MPQLTDDTIAAYGVETGWRFGLEFDVRWSELDAFRHVNHRAHLAGSKRSAMRCFLNWTIRPSR